jgi:hypothetical protein
MEPKSNLLRSLKMNLRRNGLKLTAATSAGGWSNWHGGRGGAGDQLDFLNQSLVGKKTEKRKKAEAVEKLKLK